MPVTVEFNVTNVVGVPEQIVCISGVLVITGFGLTVMAYFTGVPAQPLAVGVIAYVTFPAVAVVLVIVCVGIVLVPLAIKPVMPVADAVAFQLKVVPVTEALSVTRVEVPAEHIFSVKVVLVTAVFGLTVIITSTAVPSQVIPLLVLDGVMR